MQKTSSSRPSVLTLSGSDCSGLSGVQMDNQVLRALGVHSANIITATTAQNSQNYVQTHPVTHNAFFDQAAAVETQKFGAVKSGLIHQAQIQDVAQLVHVFGVPYVCDPVLATSSGFEFVDKNGLDLWKDKLLPLCHLITPNIPEAELLTGIPIQSPEDIEQAALKLIELGVKNVLIKGGHFDESKLRSQSPSKLYCQDYFRSENLRFWLSSPKQQCTNTRGTGCAFASAAAASIAQGYPVEDAVVIAKMAINQGLRQSYVINVDNRPSKGSLFITHFPNSQHDLPILSGHFIENDSPCFLPCTNKNLGLYPVVDSAQWLERLLPLGIKTAQIRIKELDGDALEQEIACAIELGKKYDCQLFINDYWELAIKYNAYGVHLGQEDLDSADVAAIRNAGLRLGISTHCHYEVARAHKYKPSYLACGPVYETTTKDMPWTPQGLTNLTYWKNLLEYPLVAIGGINIERASKIAQTEVAGVAMITAITLADNPEETTKKLMKIVDNRNMASSTI